MKATAPTLGTASSFAVLAGSTVTNTGPSIINGNLGVAPGSAITGFPPGIVNGTQHAGDAVAAQAKNDAAVAYLTLAGQACNHDLTGQDLGGKTLVPGVYCFSSSAQLTGTLVLSGTGTYVFQIGSTLTTASNAQVQSSSCNVYWQVGSSATLGTGTNFTGSILANTSVTLNTSSSVSGRAVALTGAVTLDSNTVSASNCGSLPSGTPTATATGTPTGVPTSTSTASSTPTNTTVPTITPTGTVLTAIPTDTPTSTSTAVPTTTPVPTATATATKVVPNLTPVVPVFVVNTPVATPTGIPTAVLTSTATRTAVPVTSTPVLVVATGTPTLVVTATATASATASATALATAPVTATATNTPETAVATATLTSGKKSSATATTTPIVYGYFTTGHSTNTSRHGHSSGSHYPVPRIPKTGYGGTGDVLALNSTAGRAHRSAGGTMPVGITSPFGTGGNSNTLEPIIPVILGSLVLALAVLTRKLAFIKR